MSNVQPLHPEPDFTQTPPHDIAAEQAVLGAMLQSPDMRPPLRPEEFYRPAHQMIRKVIAELDDKGQRADWVTVTSVLRDRGTLEQAGGVTGIHDLLEAVPAVVNAPHYARIVRRKAARRRAIEVAARMMQVAYDHDEGPDELAERIRELADHITPPELEDDAGSTDDLLVEVVGSLEREELRGIQTPWADLNDIINGLAPGEMDVIAARPGTGKSLTALNTAAHLSLREGVPSVIFSMEMSRQEVMMRLIASEGRVPLTALMKRELTDDHWERIRRASDKIMGSPLVIDDTPGCSVAHIRQRLRQMSRTKAPGLAVVDYLQLLTSTGRAENRQAEVSAFSQGLKRIAGEFRIPVLALSQLNRMAAHRSDKRPELSDLRESGSIENDASIVILLHREDTNGQESPRAGQIDFIVAKNRNGMPATATLVFQGEFARCVDMAWTPSRHAED